MFCKRLGIQSSQWLGLMVTILGVASAHGAQATNPYAERLKAASRTLTITRFAGREAFHSASSLIWSFSDGRFVETHQVRSKEQVGFSDCESIFAEHQYFPLTKMAEIGYIPVGDIMKYIRASGNFQPSTVNFSLANRELPIAEAPTLFGPSWRKRINPFYEDAPDTVSTQFVTGSMYTVAGQYLDVATGRVLRQPLPWQSDPKRIDLGKQFSRAKYPWVFELGRTAHDIPNEAQPLASAMAGVMYQEAMALGLPLKDCYVMFHSFDAGHTRLYSTYFPDTIYPEGWTNREDALFLVPLSEVLRVFPPSKYSNRLHRVIEASHGHLNDLTAMSFLQTLDRLHVTQLDVRHLSGVRYSNPLLMEDLSVGSGLRRAYLGQAFGLNPVGQESQELAAVVRTIPPIRPAWNSGQYPDLADLDFTQYSFREQNSVEITNLDPAVAATDPLYIQRTLIKVFLYYVSQIRSESGGVSEGETIKWLRTNQVKFGLATLDTGLAARISGLGPVHQEKFEPDDIGIIPRHFVNALWNFRGNAFAQYAYWFNIDQLLALIKSHPEIVQSPQGDVSENIWARQLILTNPDVF